MGYVTDKSADVYRDFVTAGVPASGHNDPSKPDIRGLFSFLDGALATLLAGFVADQAVVVYAARSSLYDNLTPADRTLGLVYNDGANNGLYIKNGAAGSGSWNSTGLMLQGQKGDAATIRVGTVSSGTVPTVVNSGTESSAVLDFTLQKGVDGKSFLQTAIDTGYVPAGTTEAQLTSQIVGQITAAAVAARDAAVVAKNQAEIAKSGSETARDLSKGWAEGPVPSGGERSSKSWAGVAQAGAAVADTARAAVELAISQVPSGTRLLLEAVTISVLRGVAADTPIGRLAYLAEPGREGVWQLRAGDYSAQIASDVFGFRYLKVTAIPATQAAWVRIVPDRIFQATWTGLNDATADALAMLKASTALIDPYSVLQLPAFRMPVGTADPRITMLVPGTYLRGHGDASWIDFIGPSTIYWLVQAAADDTEVSHIRTSFFAPNDSAGNPPCILASTHRTGSVPRALKNVKIHDVLCDRASTGIQALAHVIEGSPDLGYYRPDQVDIRNVRVRTNGVAVSSFGASNVTIEDYEFNYDNSYPGNNSPFAKRAGVRILGTEVGRIGKGVMHDFPGGVSVDAMYYVHRLYNKNLTITEIEMNNITVPYNILECRGYLDINDQVVRNSLTGTDRVTLASVVSNEQVSTIADKPTELGDLTFKNIDCEGLSAGIIQTGKMGHLLVEDNRWIGNLNVSDTALHRTAVTCYGLVGELPESTRIINNDFLMTAPDNTPTIAVGANQPGDVVEVIGNKLPEQVAQYPITAIGTPAVFTDQVEQRPFNGIVNLRTNSVHRVGSLAQRRAGTPLPAPSLPVAAPWTPNFINVSQTSAGVFQKSAGTGSYDAAVWSTEKLTGDFELVYRLNQISAYLGVGITNVTGAAAPNNMDWWIEYNNPAASVLYSYGSGLQQIFAYSTSTIERWSRKGSRLTFSRGGVVLFEKAVSPERAFALQSSIAAVGDAVEILRFGAI